MLSVNILYNATDRLQRRLQRVMFTNKKINFTIIMQQIICVFSYFFTFENYEYSLLKLFFLIYFQRKFHNFTNFIAKFIETYKTSYLYPKLKFMFLARFNVGSSKEIFYITNYKIYYHYAFRCYYAYSCYMTEMYIKNKT